MIRTGSHVPSAYLSPEARTVSELFTLRAELTPDRAAYYEKEGGTWVETSWGEFHRQAGRVARRLIERGLSIGERIAILGPTRSPWAIQDLGAQMAGLVSMGIYERQTVEQIAYVLDNSSSRIVFVCGREETEKVLAAIRDNPKVVAVVPWEEEVHEALAGTDPRLESPAAYATEPLAAEVREERLARMKPDDTSILVYTSGTTGPPKGAMISHRNILTLIQSQMRKAETHDDDLSLSFLPVAHAAERILGFYSRLCPGIPTAYATSMATLLDEISEVAPTIFGAVPRIFEKAYAQIHARVEAGSATARAIFRWADSVGRRRLRLRLEEAPVPLRLALAHRIADRLVFRKIRAAFGGRVDRFITGAAPIAVEILEFFWASGLEIYEGYGMTETTCLTHIQRRERPRLGTVGPPLDGIEQRIAEDGEILLRGPWIFQGYLENEEATSKALVDGWLHTGDIGTIDEDGYLRVVDRKKHLIITAGGKNLAPANIENAIKNEDSLISQVIAHGDRRPYVCALVAPDPLETLQWGLERGLVDAAEVESRRAELVADPNARSSLLEAMMRQVIEHPEFRERITRAVGRGNTRLARYETVRRFLILDRDFSQEHGEMTATMKIRRRVIEREFTDRFDRIYTEEGFALDPVA